MSSPTFRDAFIKPKTSMTEVGFMMQGQDVLLKKHYNDAAFLSAPRKDFGIFASFRTQDGKPIKFIHQITFYRLVLTFATSPSAMGNALGSFNLIKIQGVKAVPYRAYHYKIGQDVLADGDEIRSGNFRLSLESIVKGADEISLLRSYDEKVEATFIDALSLWQMGKAMTKLVQFPNLNFFFSGALVNYGEMVGPENQTKRFNKWEAFDPSLVFTLKAEPIAPTHKQGKEYVSVDIVNPKYIAITEVALPGLFLLDPCKDYWKAIQSITNQFSGTEEDDDGEFDEFVEAVRAWGSRRGILRLFSTQATLLKQLDKYKKSHAAKCNNYQKTLPIVARSLTSDALSELLRKGTPIMLR